MAKIISIVTGKGGMLKTTMACNIGSVMAIQGKRVLMLDLDKQSHTTKHLFRYDPEKPSISDIMLRNADPRGIVQESDIENLCVVPAAYEPLSKTPRQIDFDLSGNRVDRLKSIKELDGYDVIIIDCPPDLEILTINALVISDYVIIPVTGDRWGMEGFSDITNLVEDIRNKHNTKLQVGGIVLVKDDGSADNRRARENYKKTFKNRFFDTSIRYSKLASKASYSLPLVASYPSAKVSADFQSLTEEIQTKLKI